MFIKVAHSVWKKEFCLVAIEDQSIVLPMRKETLISYVIYAFKNHTGLGM